MAATRTLTMKIRFAHNPVTSWVELLDALGHKVHAPRWLQDRLCNAVDRQYGWTPEMDR